MDSNNDNSVVSTTEDETIPTPESASISTPDGRAIEQLFYERSDSPPGGKPKSKNTQNNTQWVMKMYNRWANEEKQEGNTEKIPFANALINENDENLARYVSMFVRNAKKQSGELYPPRTLQTLLFGINRFMRDHGRYDVNVADEHRPEFAGIQKALRERAKDYENLHNDDGMAVKHIDMVTWDHIDLLWQMGILNLTTAKGLSRAVLFYNCKVFGIKGTADQKAVRAEHYYFSQDEKGRYVAFRVGQHEAFKPQVRRTATRKCNNIDEIVKDYEVPGVPKCPYHVFGVYLSLIPSEGPFYRRPAPKSGTVATNFDEMELGHNAIGCGIKACMEEAGIPGNFATISACKSLRGEYGIDSLNIPSWLSHPKPRNLSGTEPDPKRARTGPVVWQVGGRGGGQQRLLPRPSGSTINPPRSRNSTSQPVFPGQIGSNSQQHSVLPLIPLSGPIRVGNQNNQNIYSENPDSDANSLVDIKEELYDLQPGTFGIISDQEDTEEVNSESESMDAHTDSTNFSVTGRYFNDSGIISGKADDVGNESIRVPLKSVLEQLKYLESRVKSMEGKRGEECRDSNGSSIAKKLKALESRVLTMESGGAGNSTGSSTRIENRLNHLEKRIEETYDTLNRKLSETQVTVDKIYAVLLNKF